MLCQVLPELQDCFGFEQHNPYHDKDVFEHSMAVLDNTSGDPVLRLAALLHDIGKPRTFTLRNLMQLGIQKGPEMGQILKKLLAMVWENPEINNREMLIKIVGRAGDDRL